MFLSIVLIFAGFFVIGILVRLSIRLGEWFWRRRYIRKQLKQRRRYRHGLG